MARPRPRRRAAVRATADGGGRDHLPPGDRAPEVGGLGAHHPVGRGHHRRARAWRKQVGEERLALGIGAIPDESWVFVTKAMRHYHQNGLGAAFREQVQRLGLPPITLHGLRHTHASTLLAGGVSPVAVAQRLGHKSVSTTLSTYAWALAEQRQQAADTTGAILSG